MAPPEDGDAEGATEGALDGPSDGASDGATEGATDGPADPGTEAADDAGTVEGNDGVGAIEAGAEDGTAYGPSVTASQLPAEVPNKINPSSLQMIAINCCP